MNTRDVYMNRMQQCIYYSGARDIRLLASRRFGKTDGCLAPRIKNVSSALPRSTNIWLGNSRKQLYTRTVPGTIAAIERFFGYREGIHFGWGRIPAKYPRPIIEPRSWDNIIWFANGTIWQLVSMAVQGAANGLSVTSIVGDECKFMSKARIDEWVMPALSGITHPTGSEAFSDSNPLYKSTFFASDASLTARGNWLEKEEAKLDLEIDAGKFAGKTYREIQDRLTRYSDSVIFYNELLRDAKRTGHSIHVLDEDLIVAIREKARAMVEHTGPFVILRERGENVTKRMLKEVLKYRLIDEEEAELLYDSRFLITPNQDFEMQMLMKSARFQRQLREWQCSAFCFYRANALDNIDILGESYIKKMKRDLPPLVFMVSILNAKTAKINDGFYYKLDIENVHGYVPDSCPAIDKKMTVKTAVSEQGGRIYEKEYETPDFDALSKMKDCSLDGDVMDSLPLLIAGDWNAKINWLVTGQVYKRDGMEALNVVCSHFAKNDRTLRDLCVDWHNHFKPHQKHNRTVRFFYNSTALYLKTPQGVQCPRDIVVSELTRLGWVVDDVYMGNPMQHRAKYSDINYALAGCILPAIRINRENNEALVVALEMADVKINSNGFAKDKSGEKLSEERDDAVRLELRTDGTDAFDDLWIGVKYHSSALSGMCLPIPGR